MTNKRIRRYANILLLLPFLAAAELGGLFNLALVEPCCQGETEVEAELKDTAVLVRRSSQGVSPALEDACEQRGTAVLPRSVDSTSVVAHPNRKLAGPHYVGVPPPSTTT